MKKSKKRKYPLKQSGLLRSHHKSAYRLTGFGDEINVSRCYTCDKLIRFVYRRSTLKGHNETK